MTADEYRYLMKIVQDIEDEVSAHRFAGVFSVDCDSRVKAENLMGKYSTAMDFKYALSKFRPEAGVNWAEAGDVK